MFTLAMGFCTGTFHEEIRFRGYYQGAGSLEVTPLAGFIVALIPFSFGHHFAHADWSVTQVLATVLPGIVFGLVYNATGSLVAVMTTHTLVNWIGSYPALLSAAMNSRTAAWMATIGLGIGSLLLIFFRRNKEMRLWLKITGKMFREKPVFSLAAGVAIGGVLLTLWAFRLAPVFAALSGAFLFGIAVLGKTVTRASTPSGAA